MHILLQNVELLSSFCNNWEPDLLQDRFESWVVNPQHRYLTRFATMLRNKLEVFVARFTVLLGPPLSDSSRYKIVILVGMSDPT